jgi:transposase-like protein
MPWKESRILDQRLQFLSSYQKEEMSVADLSRAYGISRPTAYRWINRYNETGPEGLVDRSRRPHSCSHATLEPMENASRVLCTAARLGIGDALEDEVRRILTCVWDLTDSQAMAR